jgi:hypothetical protein
MNEEKENSISSSDDKFEGLCDPLGGIMIYLPINR